MRLVGQMHPLIVHFPIALVIAAVVAEAVAAATRDWRWRAVAVINLRAGAAFAVAAVVAGWRLASAPGVDATTLLEWHRWLGALAALAAVVAALASWQADRWSSRDLWIYRFALFAAAIAVAVTGHLGGLLVWGPDFLRL